MSTSHKPLNSFVPGHDLLDRLQQSERRIDTRQADAANHVAQAVQVLESLPLSTEEYGMALNRLRNCVHYLKQGEWGAAGYENRLVYTWLRSLIYGHDVTSAVA